MRSKLFNLIDTSDADWKSFVENLKVLLSTDFEFIDLCLENFHSRIRAESRFEIEKIYESISNKFSVPQSLVSSSYRILTSILNWTIDDKLSTDSPEHWAADLQELKAIDSEQSDTLLELIRRLKSDFSQQAELELLKKRSGTGVLPSFVSIRYTTELRAIKKGEYILGSDLSDYEVNIKGLVPIASLSIEFYSQDQKEIYFQATESEVQQMINCLQAAVKDLNALKKYMKPSETDIHPGR